MILRREFLQLGVGAAALLPLPLQGGTDLAPSAVPPPFRLLHDSRAPQSRALAVALGQSLSGTAVPRAPDQALAGDITRFWADELYPQWQRAPRTLAGCTGQDLLFCLEQLARDHRLRVLWRTAHAEVAPVPLVSWLIAAV